MSDMNMYNILGKFNNVDPKMTPVKEETKIEPVYETVEPRGSIMEAVKTLEEKYQGFKKTVAAIAKGGSAEDPEAVAAAIGRKKYGKKKFQKAAAAGKKLGEAAKPDYIDLDKDGDKTEPMKKAAKDAKKKAVKEGQGPYELYNPKHPKFKANYEKYKKSHPDCTIAEFVAAMKKKEHSLKEGEYDPAPIDPAAVEKRKRLQAIKDRQEAEREYGDEKPSVRKVAGKAYGGSAQKDSPEGDEQLDELSPQTLQSYAGKAKGQASWAKGVAAHGSISGTAAAKPYEKLAAKRQAGAAKADQRVGDKVDAQSYDWAKKGGYGDESNPAVKEVAPPGAKAERMVKHIKKGYAKDGKLSKREKGIAYATAWKAHNKGQVEEGMLDQIRNNSGSVATGTQRKDMSPNYDAKTGKALKPTSKLAGIRTGMLNKESVKEGTKFSDIVKNSKAELKKSKPAMVKESRMLQEGDYFYEKVAKALAEQDPTLNTADSSFVTAVRKEMVAQGIEPNRARNIIMMDDDFISDVATSYGHYCKEIAECGAPMNSHLGGTMEELDEIAALAGLARAAAPAVATAVTNKVMDKALGETEVYDTVNHEETPDNMDEAVGQAPMLNGKAVDVNSIEVDGVNDWDSPDFVDAYITYAEYADGTPLSDDELDQLTNEHGDLVNQAAHGSLQGRADFVDEDTVGEGNEFSGALAKARASGAKEFEVDGKKYTVKEDVNINISANGEFDSINLIRQLAGLNTYQNILGAKQASDSGPVDTDSQEVAEEKERDVEYTNTPREETAGLDAAIPAGADLNRAKKQYKKEYPGDNPMAVKEEALWKAYESMINDVKL